MQLTINNKLSESTYNINCKIFMIIYNTNSFISIHCIPETLHPSQM